MKQLVCAWLTALTLTGGLDSAARGAVPPEPAQEQGYLGVQIGPHKDGVELLGVRPGTAADEAGLKQGDVILQVGDQRVTSVEALAELLANRGPGDQIRLKIRRGEETLEQTVRLGKRPENLETRGPAGPPRPAPPEPPESPEPKVAHLGDAPGAAAEDQGWIGIYFADADRGVRVDDTVSGSPAEQAGLEAGDVIISIDGARIEGPDDLLKSLRKAGPGKTVAFTLLRGSKPLEFDVRLGHTPDRVARPTPPVPEAGQKKAQKRRKAKRQARRAMTQAAVQAKRAESLAKRAKAERSSRKKKGGQAPKSDAGDDLWISPHGRRILILDSNGEDGIEIRVKDGSLVWFKDDDARSVIVERIVTGGSRGCCCCCCCSGGKHSSGYKIIEIIKETQEVD